MEEAVGDSVWEVLQQDLDEVHQRGMECSLCLSTDKYEVMHFGSREAHHSTYTQAGHRLKSVSIYKVLGGLQIEISPPCESCCW